MYTYGELVSEIKKRWIVDHLLMLCSNYRKLFEREYVVRTKGYLVSTELEKKFIDFYKRMKK